MTERKKYIILYTVSFALLVLSVALGLMFGSVKLSFSQILHELANNGVIVCGIRLPRVLGAALAGTALACAGLILQCVTANELCAPNIVGINAGAGFFVILILSIFPSAWNFIPLSAFCGALCTALTVLAISYSGNSHIGTTLVLAGVAISSILNAAISFLSLRFPDVLSSYTAFSVGGFSGLELDELAIPAIIIGISLICAQILSPKLSLLCLSDAVASSLGVKVRTLRFASVVIASALCAAAVSFAGLLGFVGLIVPHIVRQTAGEDMRYNLPLCALCGAALVILSDLVGRVIFKPTELPAGIIMALIGAPFFLFLLLKKKVHHD